MDELQIYNIVNDVTAQSMGVNALTVVNAQGLVALGDVVLNSGTYTEDFLNTLVKRIGKTIISARKYKSQFSSLTKDSIEWGAIVQKINVGLIEAEADQSYGLEDGQSVDHYKVAKPKVTQKLFTSDNPYQFHITIQREHLREAFLSADAMGSFINAVYTKVQNSIELALENLGRLCVNNFIAETAGTKREIKLVTIYNAAKGATLTPGDKKNMYDEDFLRFAVGYINLLSKKMTAVTKGVYNDGSIDRHTPKDLQKMYVLADFESALETQMQYGAYNDGYVKLKGYEEVSYWQAEDTPDAIKINKASDHTEVDLTGVVGVLCDTEALGIYTMEHWAATTPMNAAGGYFNTYWHEKDMYFNDTSENFVVFTLN